MNFVPTRPMESIVKELIRIYHVLYDPGFFLDRTFKHFLRMKPPPFRKPMALPYSWEFRAVAHVLWRQGFRYSSRWKFWKYLFLAMVKFPRARFDQFFAALVMGEHYFSFREVVREKLSSALTKMESEAEGVPEKD